MEEFKKEDLNQVKYKYKWSHDEGDDPQKRSLDGKKIDRDEGYEVLHFINTYMKAQRMEGKANFNRIELLMKEQMPGSVQYTAQIRNWLLENF